MDKNRKFKLIMKKPIKMPENDHKTNTGKRWTKTDDEHLIEMVVNGENYFIMEHKLGRSKDAIKGRLKVIAVNNIKSGKSLNSMVESTGISKDKILSVLHSDNIKLCYINGDYFVDKDYHENPSGNVLILDSEFHGQQLPIEISWQIRNSEGHLIDQKHYYINEPSVEIDSMSISAIISRSINHITQETIDNEGHPPEIVYRDLLEDLTLVGCVTAYNFNGADYLSIIKGMYEHEIPIHSFHNKTCECTMKMAIRERLNVKHSLGDIYRRLFSQEISNQHSATADTSACARIYYKLKHKIDISIYDVPQCASQPDITLDKCVISSETTKPNISLKTIHPMKTKPLSYSTIFPVDVEFQRELDALPYE